MPALTPRGVAELGGLERAAVRDGQRVAVVLGEAAIVAGHVEDDGNRRQRCDGGCGDGDEHRPQAPARARARRGSHPRQDPRFEPGGRLVLGGEQQQVVPDRGELLDQAPALGTLG